MKETCWTESDMCDMILVCAVRRTAVCLSSHLVVVTAGGSSSDAHMGSHLTSDALRSLYSTMTAPVSVMGTTRADRQTAQGEKKKQKKTNTGEMWDNWLIIGLSDRFHAVELQLRYIWLWSESGSGGGPDCEQLHQLIVRAQKATVEMINHVLTSSITAVTHVNQRVLSALEQSSWSVIRRRPRGTLYLLLNNV